MSHFVLNGALHRAEAPGSMTMLDYLRTRLHLTAAKEGCAEGDCGACTIIRIGSGGRHEAVNACLMLVGQADGTEILTIEGLELANGGRITPIQEAMARLGGTQCGFCTPGFISALVALGHETGPLTDDTIHEALAGNLCRCTGYRPIVDAAREAGISPFHRPARSPESTPAQRHDGHVFFAPTSLTELLALRAEHPDAMLLAGGTDLGLEASKARRQPPSVLHTARVRELCAIEEAPDSVTLGAAVTYTEALPALEALYPSFGHIVRRLGSRQIRNLGTIGGNIGNASPIGDTPPCLIALDATLVLSSPGGEREIPIEDFFVGYRRTTLEHNEVIRAIRLPKPAPGEIFRAYKVSKRYDQDISTVIGAYRITLSGGAVAAARIAYGGMDAVPARARQAEDALGGMAWSEAAALGAGAALAGDFRPITDHRGSAVYRMRVATNLLIRLWRDTAAPDGEIDIMALGAAERQ